MAHSLLPARIELDAGDRTFGSGLLLDLLSALRHTSAGDLIALTARDATALDAELDAWSRLTGHAIVERTTGERGTRWVIRHGAVAIGDADERPLGERLWLYVNFHCNLHCDYCCVRSSPAARRRELGLDRVRRIAREAPRLGVRDIFVTGGEPFLLAEIDDIVIALAEAAPVTILTNGMLFSGPRLAALKRLPRAGVTLQISLDSPEPALHDAHRGRGAWRRAVAGIDIARAEGFRVRLAATVATDVDEERFRIFLDARQVSPQDRVIRRVALRGAAANGIALSRADLVPEVTITADGVYWHPVGADDADMLVTPDIFPLADAFEAVRRQLAHERAHGDRLAAVFHCA
ncbi:MAG TPA: radical SAM protein [Gemmatimonadaceae bacterium]|nr:radical SAM protein [Gemmatimonadaceae bacterium]